MIHYLKTVKDPPEPADGCRLIIMRRYPRGVSKSRVHAWLPQLAPSLPLVHWYHETKAAIESKWFKANPERFVTELARFWATYSRRYLGEMKQQRTFIEFLATLERRFGLTLTLLCVCHDHRICHRACWQI